MSTTVTDLHAPVALGQTGLRIGRLGLGASYGAPPSAYEEAFDRGLNYFYWGSRRSAEMGEAIRNISRRSRDKLVVCVQSYTRVGMLLAPSVHLALRELRLDHADVLLLGLWNRQVPDGVMKAALRLKERGVIRYIAVSAHERPTFQEHMRSRDIDVIMARYNAAHRGAEQEVFPFLPSRSEAHSRRPGVLTYTTTRWGQLLDASRIPPGERAPRGRDCYRFTLSHPDVDAAMCGPANTAQLHEALAALDEGPMSEEELAWMRRVGDAVYATPAATGYIRTAIRGAFPRNVTQS